MSVYFLSVYGASFFLSILIAPLILVIVLTSPVWIFYRVFRNQNDSERERNFFRDRSPQLTAICLVTSLIIAFAASGWLFDDELYNNRLHFISIMIAALAVILSVIPLLRRRGFIISVLALVNYLFIWLFIFLTLSRQS